MLAPWNEPRRVAAKDKELVDSMKELVSAGARPDLRAPPRTPTSPPASNDDNQCLILGTGVFSGPGFHNISF